MSDTAVSLDLMACNCAALRKASRHVSLLYDHCLAGSGLTAGQYAILTEIARRPGSTLSALAEALVMDRTSLSRTLKPLERDGLIRLSRGRGDRRARLVHLTPHGRKRVSTAHAAWLDAQTRFSEVFGVDQAIALRALLRILTDADFGQT